MAAVGSPNPRGFGLFCVTLQRLLFLLLFLLGTLANKLNVPQVLLPFGREPGRVPFLLEAQRGCYTWHSTHHDAVTVEPLYENGTLCSQKAVLFAESTQPIRLSSVILAREIVTDHELRCDVKVDVINSIEIISRTRELYVDDSPLELMVRALDAEGNTFSSLAGMVFEWSIAQDNESAIEELSSKIRILRYSEAEYSPPAYIAEMEKEEKQGDKILVSGIKTGAAIVKVRISEPFYKKVAAALIRLLVLENIFLIPSQDIYLLVGAYIKYRVAKMVQGRMTEVKFPLEHYTLELQDHRVSCNISLSGKVALLDEKTAMVTAVQLGRTNLIFVHKNVHMRSVSGLPNCTIYVVEPGFLGFTVQPGDRWSLEVGQIYVITVEVFDKSSTKIYTSDNLRIMYQFLREYFEEQLTTVNGSYHVVKALKDGVVVINASLTSIIYQNKNVQPIKFPIKHQQEVKIYFPIKLTPNFLAFPHHPMGMLYRYKVQVEGGSGNFTWTSSNETVAMVTSKGVVTAGRVRGNSTVLARDVQNPFRYGEIKVHVLRLNKMELLPFHADVEIGQIIEIPIAMYHVNKETKEAITFTDCSHLSLDLNMDKQGVFTLLKEGIQRPGPTHCSSTHIAAKSLGHTLVTVSVTDYEEYLDSSATFAAYEPLKALNPVEVALVTWHSVKEMIFEGGPQPWVLEPSRFFLELSMEKTEKIRITQVRLPAKRKQNQYIYRVLCLDLGEQILTFQIGNHPGVLNPSPAVEVVQVRFICAHPASMSITPVYKVPAGAQPCPLPQHNKQLIPVSSLRDTVLELAVFDQHRRKFDNFSSLMLEWKSLNETLAHFENYNSVEMVAKDDGSGQTRLHGHQILKVHQIKGTVLIGVNFVGYSEKKSPKELSNLPRSAAVELLLVDDVTVLPENATIYNHPDVKEIFSLVEGSGYFLVNSSEQDIVTITYLEAESSVQLVPLHPGILTLEVYDLCLAFLGPAMAHLRVSDIQELELDLIDKVEIGKTVSVTVRVLGSSKRPFQNKYFRNMELKLQLASAIVTLALMEEQDEYSENYILRAITVGQTTLVAIARDKMGRKFTSTPRQIEVFPPFRLVPEKMTLIPTNMMQVMSEGGPQPQSIIHFSISNQTVAVVNRRGQVTGKVVGRAVVHGTIQTVNEDTGKVIVFSQDEVQIEVVQLRAVRILAAATRLITATEMPVYVMGVTSTQTPFSFSSANPGLTFHWSMSKRDVLDLVPRHSEVFLQLPVENNFAMVVHTKAAGRTNIKVTVRCMNSSSGQFERNLLELSDEVQILVFEKLQLFYPECQPEQILMPMNSQLKLHTNREGAAFVSSRVLKCFPNSSVIEEDGEGLLKAGSIAGEPGMWMISADNILQTDIVTGVGVARSPGIATIFHDIPGLVKTYREVVVNASSRLTLSYDLKTYLTNTPNSTVFKLFITAGRNGINLKGSCTPSQALAITTLLPETLMLCHVQFSNTSLDIPASKVFHVHSDFSMEKGVYVCLIKVRPQSEELLQVLSTADTSVYGWATLVSERSKNGMQRIIIPFIPAFYINQSELVLSHKKDVGELRILGVDRVLEKLEVFPSSPVLVVSGRRHSSLTPGLAIYPIRVVSFTSLQQMESPVFINISCVLTSQSEAVRVRAMKAKSGADQCDGSGVLQKFAGSYQILLFTLFVVLASTAFLFLAYNAFLNKIQTVPVVYVPTLGTQSGKESPSVISKKTQVPPSFTFIHPSSISFPPLPLGSYTSTRSPPPFMSPQPPPAQNRLQHWLWSIRH
ncbi:nuclear pore membrane glycoprotein 210-like isoform X7 [Odocoileus virginianus]|uniref:Nuclear pore membrane glycoprotein 210-like isoform X7 n=1 Tax=Odocoileus virginianus TaxID=9874 RepID=A0A6J0WZD9_ODOVR